MPKQKVSYPPVGQRPLQQEGGEVAVQVGLVLQDLDQLDQVLQQLIVTVEEMYFIFLNQCWYSKIEIFKPVVC